jgi:ubiquinone/menaquinone biosynthesis C-methylase UbiE
MPKDLDRSSSSAVHLKERLAYSLNAIEANLSNLLRPPARILAEIGISSGQRVVDYGCGPGGFSVTAARLVGLRGKVYAVDMNPLALASVMRSARKRGLANVVPLSPEEMKGIPDDSIDVGLLFDVLHAVPESRDLVQELHRIISPEGFVCVRDNRIGNIRIMATMTAGGFFELFHHSMGQDSGHGFKKAKRVSLE